MVLARLLRIAFLIDVLRSMLNYSSVVGSVGWVGSLVCCFSLLTCCLRVCLLFLVPGDAGGADGVGWLVVCFVLWCFCLRLVVLVLQFFVVCVCSLIGATS